MPTPTLRAPRGVGESLPGSPVDQPALPTSEDDANAQQGVNNLGRRLRRDSARESRGDRRAGPGDKGRSASTPRVPWQSGRQVAIRQQAEEQEPIGLTPRLHDTAARSARLASFG